MSADDRAWLADQVGRYLDVLPRYERYEQVLDAVLRRATADLAPLAIVQARHKSVASFAEKCLRKRARRPDPIRQLTDLCGARVIARTRSEVEAICRFLEADFEIDWEDSVDASARLQPSEFGYRSIHYIVSLRADVDYGVPVPPEVVGLRAEVQVRTIAEHAYSDFVHDLTYKGAFELPLTWRRELAGAAATLEEVDGVFSRVEGGLREYASAYGRYLSEPEAQAETERLEIVLEHDPANVALADRLARLAMARGDWTRAVRVLSPVVEGAGGRDGGRAPSSGGRGGAVSSLRGGAVSSLRDLGIALCHLHGDSPRGEGYRTGQAYLDAASRAGDVEATCAAAASWRDLDPERARELYGVAFDRDPTDPRALAGYLEVQLGRETGLVGSLRPVLRQGVERCRRRIDAGLDLPRALFDLALFEILLGEPYDALGHLAQAVALCHSPWVIRESLDSLDRLTGTLRDVAGVEWARRLLLLALAADDDGARVRVAALATPGASALRAPVVIVAGGTDRRVEAQMAAYRGLLGAALADFAGTVLSGGTRQGICGVVGALAEERGGSVRTVGYLPLLLPADASVDPGYDEIRQTTGHSFSALEPLQNWTDLVASGIAPSSVRVLGFGGGRIAAAEYRIALALGATVGLVAESGREAGRLLGEGRWSGRGVLRLPADAETLRAFISPPSGALSGALLERVARAAHESYRRERMKTPPSSDPSLAEWEDLPADLRASNIAQAQAIGAKVARVGCAVVPVEAPGEPASFTAEEVEELSEAEHGRWVVERLLAGWTWGEAKDVVRRVSPYLVEWDRLPEEVREWDREAVRAIPDLLAGVGLAMRRAQRPV